MPYVQHSTPTAHAWHCRWCASRASTLRKIHRFSATMLARPPVLPREPALSRKCVLLVSVGDYDHHSQIFCERDVLEQQRPWCLPFSKKNRSRAVQLINVCALLVASGSINLDVHLSSCHVRDVLRYFRARALMLVCVDYNSVSRAVRAASARAHRPDPRDNTH